MLENADELSCYLQGYVYVGSVHRLVYVEFDSGIPTGPLL